MNDQRKHDPKLLKRYSSTHFHYVAPKPHEERTLCGKAADSPTLTKTWEPPLGVVRAGPELCETCREVLLNAQAQFLFDQARALLEDAQHTLYKAASTIGGVTNGGSIANGKLAQLGRKAHDLWKHLSYSFTEKHAHKLSLDHANSEPFLRGVEAHGFGAALAYFITHAIDAQKREEKAAAEKRAARKKPPPQEQSGVEMRYVTVEAQIDTTTPEGQKQLEDLCARENAK